jgi:subtilisin family serine protease
MPRRPILLASLACLLLLGAIPQAASGTQRATWVRVQLDHRITQTDHGALEEAGLRYLQYSPVNAYLAYGTPAAIRGASALGGVGSVRAVGVSEKIDPALLDRSGRVPVAVTSAAVRTGLPRLLSALGPAGGGYRLRTDGALTVFEVLVGASDLGLIAARPEVLHVGVTGLKWQTEDEGATQILAANLNAGKPIPGYEAFLNGLGLDGSGVKVSIVDDGVEANHPDLTGRVETITHGPTTQGPPEGHGTHVAGIVGGTGAIIGPLGRIKDSTGLLYGIGVAPAVRFINQPAIQLTNTSGGPGNFPPPSFEIYTQPSVRAGAIGWNASWNDGSGPAAGYTARAASLDALTRDADTATAGNQQYTMVFSAGNSGPGQRTMTGPHEAKNIITVASSKGHRAGNVDDISSFSSRGPAVDGRILPSVAAPGEDIISARAPTGALCTTDPPADGYGLYSACSGTSMASPQVTGSVALIHDWWRERHGGADSSPAMDKALLINSATDLKAKDIPNRNEGWGRVNLKALFDPAASRVYVDQSVLLTDPGASHDLSVAPVDSSKPMRVTLVWTDPAGEPNADPALVNDLDLSVTSASGTEYWGNNFDGGRSVEGFARDELNNVECVYVDGPSGTYTVSVSAFNLPGDGVPGAGDQTDQDFALVISNATLAA